MGAGTEVAGLAATAFLLAVAGTVACERIARRVGLVTAPAADRWHRQPVPLLGGVAVIVATLGPLAVTGTTTRLASFLVLALGMGLVGLIDDVRPLPPQAKLVAQIVAAAALIQSGWLLRLTDLALVNVFLTVFWVVGITNAFNLLDNMDGLAAGMATIAAAFRLAFSVMDGDWESARLIAAFMGATAGFLVRNFPPARSFMGDAGSLFVGFFLSGACLTGEYAYSRGVTAVLVLPVLLLLIPIFDTTFVTLTRLVTGRPVSQGGRDHTSHRLVGLGITERQVLAILYGVSILSGGLALMLYRYGLTYTLALLALLLVALLLLGVQLHRAQVIRPQAGAADRAIVRLLADFPFKRQAATVAIDLILIVTAYYSAYLLRFEGSFDAHRDVFLATVGPVIVLQVLTLAALGSYRGLWRYTSLPELLRLLRGATLGVGATVLYLVFTTRFAGLSRAVFVLDWLVLVVLLAASRVSYRLLGEVLRPPPGDSRRVLIYGAGDGGEVALRELRKDTKLRREPVGFLDDDRSKIGMRIHEVPVLGDLATVESLLESRRVAEVIVASDRIPAERIRRLEAICASRGIAVARAVWRVE
jgi:UDP-GlcNAc:undecaprenyl-phosphate GlcNAc-1-phosphate transferase